MAYLDADGFKLLTIAPAEYVDAIEVVHPGWLERQLASWSRKIDARLRKRYAVPFDAPVPEVVQEWLAALVTYRLFLRRGVDPLDQQMEQVKADFDAALAELAEAADSNEGLYELPLRADTSASGVSKGGPFSYTEASPYVWTDEQARVGREEDRRGSGSHG